MKYKLIFTIVFCILLVPNSCEKATITVCGIENPHENLDWLKQKLLNIWSADFYKLTFRNLEYIIISDKDIVIDGIAIVYNCQGQILCEDGGQNPGGNVCELEDPKSFWDSYNANKILLFKLRAQNVILLI